MKLAIFSALILGGLFGAYWLQDQNLNLLAGIVFTGFLGFALMTLGQNK